MGNRRKARECALQLMYGLEFNVLQDGAETRQYLADFWHSFPEESSKNEDVRAFAEALVLGVRNNDEPIDALIQKASTNWKLERMSLVDRNILRIATHELRNLHDIPPKVSLNEAIEIAKRYGTEDSSSFVNGILDKISSQSRRKPNEAVTGSP